MAEIDMIKAKVENLRENYKTLLVFLLTLLGTVGTMIFMAVDKSNPIYYVLAAGSFTIFCFAAFATRKVWVDLDQKTEELKNV